MVHAINREGGGCVMWACEAQLQLGGSAPEKFLKWIL